jgi:transcriptional regulator with XRE-family HTH domain
MHQTFGIFIREMRLKADLSLRKFCQLAQIDPSNWSKVERDIMIPSYEREKMEEISKIIKLEVGSQEYFEFFDLAAIAKRKIPDEVYSDQEVLEALPIFFRTVHGQKPTPEELDKVIHLLKNR